jgi:hypothetical protein
MQLALEGRHIFDGKGAGYVTWEGFLARVKGCHEAKVKMSSITERRARSAMLQFIYPSYLIPENTLG